MSRGTTHRPEFHRNAPVKAYCRVATTGSITISTALNAGDTIDGVTLAAGDRVLVKDQGTASQNGLYVAGVTPARAYDMDDAGEVVGTLVMVTEGTVNGGSLWRNTNTGAITLDTTNLTFALVNASSPNAELNIEGGQDVIKVHGSMGSTETFDPTDGNVHTGTLNADCTFTLSAPTGTGACTLELWITGSGTHTWTWPGSVTWDGGVTGSPPASGATVRVILETIDGGTTWIANMVGGSPVTTGAPALTLSTTNSAGAASTVIATDATIAVFDATAPVTLAFGDSATAGSAGKAARRDHGHGMPAAPATGSGPLLIADTHSTPLVFADILQTEAQDDLIYQDI